MDERRKKDRRHVSELDPIYQAATLADVARSLHGLHILVSQNFSKFETQLEVMSERVKTMDADVRDHDIRLRAAERTIDLAKAVENHEERLRAMDDRTHLLNTKYETITARASGAGMTVKVVWPLVALLLGILATLFIDSLAGR